MVEMTMLANESGVLIRTFSDVPDPGYDDLFDGAVDQGYDDLLEPSVPALPPAETPEQMEKREIREIIREAWAEMNR